MNALANVHLLGQPNTFLAISPAWGARAGMSEETLRRLDAEGKLRRWR